MEMMNDGSYIPNKDKVVQVENPIKDAKEKFKDESKKKSLKADIISEAKLILKDGMHCKTFKREPNTLLHLYLFSYVYLELDILISVLKNLE